MLQFITDHPTVEGTTCQVINALKGGCRWIQIRMKEATDREVERAIDSVIIHCREVGATLIVDDRVEVVARTDARGLHLGKNDMKPEEARSILGPDRIIGATVNSIEDIDRLNLETVDYLGIGPFRFTSTKKNLAPTLGLEGYRTLMTYLRRYTDIPAVAIGGIAPGDIPEIMNTGVTGVAISGAIHRATDPIAACREILTLLSIEVTQGQTHINHTKSNHYI